MSKQIVMEVANAFRAELSRPLASIVKVKRLFQIHNADKIMLAEIKGWKCVVKKDEFQEGDLATYISIDAIVDGSDPNFAFLNGKNRIKTCKLRGVLSQGLLCPMGWLASRGVDISKLDEGDDVTSQMGVEKYVAPEEASQYNGAKNLTPFPPFVRKTAEGRLQDDGFMLELIKGRDIVITRKEDGCSCTFIWCDGQFYLCGRNFILENHDGCNSHYFEMKDKFDLENKLNGLKRNIALQGEVVGGKINGNKLKLKSRDYRVFNVFDIDNQSYLGWNEMVSICDQLGLHTVPLVYQGPADKLTLTTDAFLELARNQSYGPKLLAEGIVVKTDDDQERTSFKVISNEYLLKYE